MPADYTCPHPDKCGAQMHDPNTGAFRKCRRISAELAANTGKKTQKKTPAPAPADPGKWVFGHTPSFTPETAAATYTYDDRDVEATAGKFLGRPSVRLESSEGVTYLTTHAYQKADGSGSGTFVTVFTNERNEPGNMFDDEEFRGVIERTSALGAFPLCVFHDPERGVLVSDPVRYDELPVEMYVVTPEERANYVDQSGLVPESYPEQHDRLMGMRPFTPEERAEYEDTRARLTAWQDEWEALSPEEQEARVLSAHESHAPGSTQPKHPKEVEFEEINAKLYDLDARRQPSEDENNRIPRPRMEGGKIPGAKSLAAFLTSPDGQDWVKTYGNVDLFRSPRYARGPAGWDGDPYPDPYAMPKNQDPS